MLERAYARIPVRNDWEREEDPASGAFLSMRLDCEGEAYWNFALSTSVGS
jgi:hypothetical protein